MPDLAVVTPDELPAFTPDQARALGECRFVTVNVARDKLIALTRDKTVADAVGLGCTPHSRQQWSDPADTDYEIVSGHPLAVEAAVKIMETRREAVCA